MRARVWVFGLLLAAAAAGGQPAPYTPASDSEVLQRVPPASDLDVRRIASLRARLAADPRNARAADDLARAYVDFGRRVGDAHYAGYAEAVIAPWMAASPPPPILVTQATILQYRHDFDGARTLLDKALAQDARLAQAWLTLAAIDLVQGDYVQAAAHCTQVAKHGGVTAGLACTAGVRLVTGGAQQAMALLVRVDADSAELSPAYRAWIHGLRAEGAARLGRASEAEASYRRALAILPGDNFALCAYADFLLDGGRAREAVALLAGYADSDTIFLRLTLAHTALRSADAARYRWAMAARFEAYRQRDDESFGREEARFLLHAVNDPDAALDVALRNWRKQKEPADARLVLEAAAASRNPSAATPVLAFVAQSKLEDPRIEVLVRTLKEVAP
jgi:tetratricopeptide (TPR) repeat protein